MAEKKEFLGRGWASPVTIDPRTASMATTAYEADIRQSIFIILGTAPGERLMRPDFGCGIYELVFDSLDATALRRIQSSVSDAISEYEARVEVLQVDAYWQNATRGELLIELEYRVRRTNQIGNLVYPFYIKEGGVAPRADTRAAE